MPLISRIQSSLLRWYETNKRNLPWRRKPSLYTAVLSEFMLQQTRVDQMIPYYHRFLEKFPTLKRLAEAPFAQVIKLWEGLGYYRRAKNLHQTVKKLAAQREINLDLLRRCPGVGDYTLAAVGSIALREPLAVVDGNVKRVIARFFALEGEIEKPDVGASIRRVADLWLYRRASGDWNQAMMELGATVCTPRNPLCACCPLKFGCKAFKLNKPEEFPKRLPKRPKPRKYMAAAVILRDGGECLILRRPNRGLLPNLWEFPNVEITGKSNSGRLLKETLYKNMNIRITVGKKIADVHHAYTHFSVTASTFLCRVEKGGVMLEAKQKLKWISAKRLSGYPFPKVHKPVVDFLIKHHSI